MVSDMYILVRKFVNSRFLWFVGVMFLPSRSIDELFSILSVDIFFPPLMVGLYFNVICIGNV
jgi:hypothetical protein